MLWLPTEKVRFELAVKGSRECGRASDLVEVRPSGAISIQIDAGATAYAVGGSRFIESLLALVNVFATSGAPAARPVSAVVRTLEPGPSFDGRGLLVLWNKSLTDSSTASAQGAEVSKSEHKWGSGLPIDSAFCCKHHPINADLKNDRHGNQCCTICAERGEQCR